MFLVEACSIGCVFSSSRRIIHALSSSSVYTIAKGTITNDNEQESASIWPIRSVLIFCHQGKRFSEDYQDTSWYRKWASSQWARKQERLQPAGRV